MAMSQFEVLWELMSEYSFEGYEDCITDGLTCIICKQLITNAYQSYCGCQYCYDCIEIHLEEEDKYCPGNNIGCKEELLVLEGNVNKNPSTNEKISKLKVNCLNKSCVCKIELINMKEHLRVCPKQPLLCPYISIGCEDEGRLKDSVLTHFHDDTFTHTKLLMKCIQNMKNKVGVLKNNFEESKLEISPLKEESRVKEVQIMEQIELIKEESRNKEIELKNEIEFKISSLRDESIMKETEMKKIIENQNKEITLLKEEFKEMKKEKLKRVFKIDNKMDEEIKKRRLSNSIKLLPNIDVDFVWKIDEIKRKMETREFYFSQSFYSNDYKLCLSLLFIRDNICLQSWIMKGDNDDRVKWPLNKYITVGIVDTQSRTVFKSIKQHYNKQQCYKEAFNKPNKDRNNNFIYFENNNGCFITFSSLIKERRIINDSLIVFCVLSDN